MPSSRAISLSLLATSVGQSKVDGRNGPAEAGGVLDLVMDVRADHEQLFRHAAADHAGAAHPVFFGDHDPRAMAGGDPGGANPARTSSDDKQIDVELSHAPAPTEPVLPASQI